MHLNEITQIVLDICDVAVAEVEMYVDVFVD